MMDLIREMMQTPEAQSDPHHWAATLLAHAWLGLAAALVLPWSLVVTGYAAWEAVQWRRYGAGLADCLLDWCAVAMGVAVAVLLLAGHDVAAAALGAVLVAGIGMWVRRR